MKEMILLTTLFILFLINWHLAERDSSVVNWIACVVCGVAVFARLLVLGGII